MSDNEGGDSRFLTGFLVGFVVGVLICLGAGGAFFVVYQRSHLAEAEAARMEAEAARREAEMQRERAEVERLRALRAAEAAKEKDRRGK